MRQLILIATASLLFTSCTTVHKTFSKSKSTSDSTNLKSVASFNALKKDSTGAGHIQTTQNKTSDSSYKKTTIVKEIYSDEFSLDGVGHDSYSPASGYFEIRKTPITEQDYLPISNRPNEANKVKKVPGQLLYRETEITEEGKLISAEQVKKEIKETATVSASENAGKLEGEKTNVTVENTETDNSTTRKKFLSGLVVFLFIGSLMAISYKIYKSKI
jgi:hypothetical protein